MSNWRKILMWQHIEDAPQSNPVIESYDDISDVHQEIEGYTRCIRVNFTAPFYALNDDDYEDDDRLEEIYESAEYEESRERFEECAIDEIFNGVAPNDVIFDWRDEQELWIRYN